eukprot:Pompholyxophrys_sp_v1_NODE_1_length_32789_cov_6.460653.p16 type:complete len:244 gc:universal NODE_1_length_32789_cov_6.460653:2559-1828(-)
MDLIRYVLFFGIILFIGYYIKTNIFDKSNSSSAVQTPGFLIDREAENINDSPNPYHLEATNTVESNRDLINDLDRDQLGGSYRNQKGGSCCLPGSPGANEYNYGKHAADSKCGPVTVFDPNGLGKSDNFRKSTPEVINGRTANWIPPHMISQLHYVGPFEEVEVQASNQNVVESTCNFVSEKTNLAQYFKANPDLYLATDKFSTFKPFVPFTSAWKEQSDCFNNIKYSDDRSIPGNFVVNKVL